MNVSEPLFEPSVDGELLLLSVAWFLSPCFCTYFGVSLRERVMEMIEFGAKKVI